MKWLVLTVIGFMAACATAPIAAPPPQAMASPRDAARIELRFTVRTPARGGNVVVALYADEKTFLKEGRAVKTARAVADAPSTIVSFEDVAAGRYAAAAYQDENADGTLDRSLIGYPSEPFGFSNAGRVGVFGPPSFDDCAFDAAQAITEQTITLR